MGFIPITIDDFVKIHLKHNPSENEAEIKKNLKSALNDYKNGVKCSCGSDIWVIGSAWAGNSCFTCITGESHSTDDYEIDSAVKKMESTKGRRHINDIDPAKISGFFSDDGYEINSDLIKKPSLCLVCAKNDDPNEEMLCNMNRYDQKDEIEFKCFAFCKK